eukprot:CAMPEP_0196709224 /NCGR_PEP_ID=MMETSP1090-20130531/67666_1 /TAXON_ID=37098 /ORGANISM="Isochrysis sp, Strain CCMP1244" /LENGTH=55 /DNA_ID=CAMNT_0042049235 /DNA_START=66 /DNA_END=229 /DNA_ORIENTATION=+
MPSKDVGAVCIVVPTDPAGASAAPGATTATHVVPVGAKGAPSTSGKPPTKIAACR